MANKSTTPLTEEQFTEIVTTIAEGFSNFRPNRQIATILFIQGNTGRRIGDILQLRMADFREVSKGKYEMNITEQKTGKPCRLQISPYLYDTIKDYFQNSHRKHSEPMFTVKERVVQKTLSACCDFLDEPEIGKPYKDIGTHSFRKFAATKIYEACGNDIVYAARFLNHSNPAITARYLRVDTEQLDKAMTSTTTMLTF